MGDKAAVEARMQTVQYKIESGEVLSERYGVQLGLCVNRRSGKDAAEVRAGLFASCAKARRPETSIGQDSPPCSGASSNP